MCMAIMNASFVPCQQPHVYGNHARLMVGVGCLAAPEIISNRHDYDGKLVDVWSAGVMLYVMLYCHYPFEPPPEVDPGKKMQARFLLPYLYISPYCHYFVKPPPDVDPGKRFAGAACFRCLPPSALPAFVHVHVPFFLASFRTCIRSHLLAFVPVSRGMSHLWHQPPLAFVSICT